MAGGADAAPSPPPVELSELGLITPLEREGYVPEDEALRAAAAQGYTFAGASRDAFLVRLTSAHVPDLRDRPVWVVRFTAISVNMPAPQPATGTLAPRPSHSRAYVIIDAVSAEFLHTLYL